MTSTAGVRMIAPDSYFTLDAEFDRDSGAHSQVMVRRICLIRFLRLGATMLVLPATGALGEGKDRDKGKEKREVPRWIGTYRSDSQSLLVTAGGQFEWVGSRLPVGREAGRSVHASGMVVQDGEALRLEAEVVDAAGGDAAGGDARWTAAQPSAPRRLYARHAAAADFLLTEVDVAALANSANALSTVHWNASALMRRDPVPLPVRHAQVAIPALLTGSLRSRLLSKPLLGRVIAVGEIAQKSVDVVVPLRAPQTRLQYSTTLVIKLDGAQKGFPGMLLFVGPARHPGEVERIDGKDCELTVNWTSDPPVAGDRVSSSGSPA